MPYENNYTRWYNKTRTVSILIALFLVFCFQVEGYSHEIYQSYPLRWYSKITESGKTKLYLKANKDYLNSPFVEVYNSALNNWSNAWSANATMYNIHSVSHVKCVDTTFLNANLFFCTANPTWWDSMFGGSTISKYVEGYTTLKNIYGTEINSSTIQSCDRNIGQATIYVSPYVTATTHTLTQRRGILMHEMGHAMGLGHPNYSDSRNSYSADSYGSIMDYSYTEEYPIIHDICDIEIMYGFNCYN